MSVVSFQFTPETDRHSQDQLLGRLEKLAGVRAAGRVDPETDDPEVSRMCFAEVAAGHPEQVVVGELHKADGVEGVSIEPRRGLN